MIRLLKPVLSDRALQCHMLVWISMCSIIIPHFYAWQLISGKKRRDNLIQHEFLKGRKDLFSVTFLTCRLIEWPLGKFGCVGKICEGKLLPCCKMCTAHRRVFLYDHDLGLSKTIMKDYSLFYPCSFFLFFYLFHIKTKANTCNKLTLSPRLSNSRPPNGSR